MTRSDEQPQPLKRVATGVPGLDTVLRGGFLAGGVYIIRGAPGAGKTILANQICFNHVHGEEGGRALYVTLLAEDHARLMQHMGQLAFFDPSPIPRTLYYISGFRALEEEGLRGLIALLRREVRSHGATLLVLDGLLSVEETARSDREFRKFIHELQAHVASENCIALMLTNGSRRDYHPEHTMVEGLVTLDNLPLGARRQRVLEVLKLRGTGFLRGQHPFRITDDGIEIYPRVEALLAQPTVDSDSVSLRSLGVPKLDAMTGGGLLAGSTGLLLGASGTGKTTLGLHFLSLSSDEEPGLHFGFYETPQRLLTNARLLGLDLDTLVRGGQLEILWQPPTEQILDDLGNKLIDAIHRRKVKRLFIDGIGGYLQTADHRERIAQFFSAISGECRAQGVTTLYAAETRNLVGPDITMPIEGISAVVENVILLRFVELRARLYRLLSILKVRGSAFDPTMRDFRITDQGIDLSDSFEHAEQILSGYGVSTDDGPAGTKPTRTDPAKAAAGKPAPSGKAARKRPGGAA